MTKKKGKANGTRRNGNANGKGAKSARSWLPPLYDGKVRPPLSCLARIVDERADVYRPYRGVLPRNLLLYHDTVPKDDDDEEELDVLVCGCGDLRDVMQSLIDAQSNDSHRPIHFLLNDIRPEVLARNLLILHALSELYKEEDDEYGLAALMGQLWYSSLLEPETRVFWDDQMRQCLAKDWVNSSAQLRVLDDETQRAIRHCWQSWLNVDWTVETLFEKRRTFMQSHPDPAVRDADPAATTST
ncbi:hypothetical protein H9P43_003627 [Blastocladiella emersonii ATCC 22665]|nr:hypothetical protein H9P43_003627 [Blastocladiella emersonii ATCC 22665]